jgi:hypothetical protein
MDKNLSDSNRIAIPKTKKSENSYKMLKISILQRYLKKSDLFRFLVLDNDGEMWYSHTPARTRPQAHPHPQAHPPAHI